MTRELDVDLLAALDAGLLEPPRARAVRAGAAADPAATQVLAALVATRAELAAQPELRVPPEVAARWAAAVGAGASGPADSGPAAAAAHPGAGATTPDCAPDTPHPVHGDAGPATPGTAAGTDRVPEPLNGHAGTEAPAPGTRGTRPTAWRATTRARAAAMRRAAAPHTRRRAAALAAAAVLAATLAGGGVLAGRSEPADPPTRLDRFDLAAAGTSAVGTLDAGELADPTRRAACLAAVVPDAAGASLLGARRVVLDDRAGVLLVLGGGALGRVRLVVVDPRCGLAGGAGGTVLADVTVGQ